MHSATIELRHAHARFQGDQQESTDCHEERNCRTTDSTIIKSHPKAIAFVGKHRHIACQTAVVSAIEILAGVHQHYHKASDDTYPVDKCDALFSYLLIHCSEYSRYSERSDYPD